MPTFTAGQAVIWTALAHPPFALASECRRGKTWASFLTAAGTKMKLHYLSNIGGFKGGDISDRPLTVPDVGN